MIIEDPEAFKGWLASILVNWCDADPLALAKYIFALVKKDKSAKELEQFLLEQLDIFFMKETKNFVELLLDNLERKVYMSFTEVESSSLVGHSDPSLPTKNIMDTDALQKDIGAGLPVEMKSTNNTPDDSQRVPTTPGNHGKLLEFKFKIPAPWKSPGSKNQFQKQKNDDKQIPSEKIKPCDSHPEENYSTEKGKEDNSNDGTFRSTSRSNVHSTAELFTQDGKEMSEIEHPKLIQSSVLPHGDTDYRQKKIGNLTTSVIQSSNKTAYSTKQSTRCKDYDEKGYCLKGDFCDFDHGNDPILVEHVSALKYGVDISPEPFKVSAKSPLPPLPTSPPPPQPPLPPSDPLIPEPYNPESPGMNMGNLPQSGLNTHLDIYVPSVPLNSHLVSSSLPSLPSMVPKATSGMNNMIWRNAEPSYNQKPKQRIRELIGVTTVDSSSMNLDQQLGKGANNDKTFCKPSNSGYFTSAAKAQTFPSDYKAPWYNYNRLGASPRRKCLEIRKIPRALNTITNIYNHFGKFGSIVNIEVGFSGDPEAAKITFSSHFEATAAYRSTEPILNNRFIKVFWNNDSAKEIASTSSKEVQMKESFLSSEINTGAPFNYPSESSKEGVAAIEKFSEKSLFSKGNIPRSAYISGAKVGLKRKANFFLTTARKALEKEAVTAHKKKKYELHQAKSELIKSQIEHQKVILEQLLKTKNTKEKDFLKKTLLTTSEQIKNLQNELKKDNEELVSLLKSGSQDIIKSDTKKELLDAELDLYNKQHAGMEDFPELAQNVLEMKNKAEALGLIRNPPKKHSVYVFKRQGNPRYRPSCTVSSLSVDHRPRKVLVIGSTDQDNLHKHFKQYGDIEKVEEKSGGYVFTFSSRMEAETAYAYGTKFEDKMLNLSWFTNTDVEAVAQPEVVKDNPADTIEVESVAVDMDIDDDDDDEEEDEDSRTRFWRH